MTTNPTRIVSIRISDNSLTALDEAARRAGLSRSAFIDRWIRRRFDTVSTRPTTKAKVSK